MPRAFSSGIYWVLVLCLLLVSGCSIDRQHGLSTTPPFEAYVGKEVVLVRDTLLVDTELPALRYVLVDPELHDDPDHPEVQRREADSLRSVRLSAGTRIRVERTYLWRRGVAPTVFDYLLSEVTIPDLHEEGWPPAVEAAFNHASTSYNNWFGLLQDPFRGTIRVAPWESTSTPVKRRFALPSDLQESMRGKRGAKIRSEAQ